jgi:stage II sporulation protein R
VSKVEVKAEVSLDKTVVEKVEPVKEETDVKEAKKQQVEVKKQTKQVKKDAPVYTAEDEEPVKVKFFVVEMWDKMFK